MNLRYRHKNLHPPRSPKHTRQSVISPSSPQGHSIISITMSPISSQFFNCKPFQPSAPVLFTSATHCIRQGTRRGQPPRGERLAATERPTACGRSREKVPAPLGFLPWGVFRGNMAPFISCHGGAGPQNGDSEKQTWRVEETGLCDFSGFGGMSITVSIAVPFHFFHLLPIAFFPSCLASCSLLPGPAGMKNLTQCDSPAVPN